MSQISTCPTCGGKSKTKETDGNITYTALENEELIKKVGQLKKAMQKFKDKSESLEKELNDLKSNK